jgi:hypothetical protein
MARKNKFDVEIEQYRDLMKPPEKFEDGFTWKTMIGAMFLGFIMMPASMYLNLFAGGGSFGTASQWVTIIIFAEVARRSLKDLKMQEVYILYYMAGLAIYSPFSGLLWDQFLVQSEYVKAMGIAHDIPAWFAPSEATIREAGRTFYTKDWIAPIAIYSMALITSMIDNYGLGYILYRLTSDVEQLPFPYAPVAASAITALTERKGERQPWRWRCFSIGGMIGLIFGAVYVGVPAVTGSILTKPLQLLPIPFVDFTQQVSTFLPATPVNITLDIGAFLAGTVLPFWAVVGSSSAVILTFFVNPTLYRRGILSNWNQQMDFINSTFSNQVDFYLSFGIGITIAITLTSMWRIIKPLGQSLFRRLSGGARDVAAGPAAAKQPSMWQKLITNNVVRGDFSIFVSLGIYLFNTALWIGLSTWLVEGFPWYFFVGYALIYTPLIAYASAKLEGLVGMVVTIPLIKEATYILSGYRGIKIWFAPMPLPNYAGVSEAFRIMELTGTKVISQVKTQLVTVPIIIIASLIFSQILWQMAPVPSEAYPFANKMWDLNAKNACLTYSSTMEGGSLFMEAWKWNYFGLGILVGVGAYIILSLFGLPTMLVYGLVQGMGGAVTGAWVLQITGAIVGKVYLRKKFGDNWLRYAPVILAGYSCGMGLLAMLSVSFTILMKMMSPLLF